MPPELQGRPDVSPHLFWSVLSQQPTAHLCIYAAWIAAGLCGIAAVPAWFTWTGLLLRRRATPS
jgi:hypothetical protein